MVYPELELSSEIKQVLDSGGYGGVASTESESLPKLKAISERIKQVEDTESALQVEFWNIRNKFRANSLGN